MKKQLILLLISSFMFSASLCASPLYKLLSKHPIEKFRKNWKEVGFVNATNAPAFMSNRQVSRWLQEKNQSTQRYSTKVDLDNDGLNDTVQLAYFKTNTGQGTFLLITLASGNVKAHPIIQNRVWYIYGSKNNILWMDESTHTNFLDAWQLKDNKLTRYKP